MVRLITELLIRSKLILRLFIISSFSLSWVAVSSVASALEGDNNELEDRVLSVAMLHIAPKLAKSIDDITENTQLIEKAMRQAKSQGARWVMTPELALTGYKFKAEIGTNWIENGTDRWTQHLQQVADELNVVLFLSHLEKDDASQLSYNTLFVINTEGEIIARHRKINTIPGSESWSSKGTVATVVNINEVKVGLLICADAWPKKHAQSLKNQGAQIILSSANWAPGLYGPGETWENRVTETGLAMLVNNRTGSEKGLDMSASSSVVSVPTSHGAKRSFEHQSADNFLLQFSFNLSKNTIDHITKNKL